MKIQYLKKTGMTLAAICFAFMVNAGENKLNTPNNCFHCDQMETYENFNEKSNDLETWMLDYNFFKINKTNAVQFSDFDVSENKNEIESWMLDDRFWKINQHVEDEIALEDWMFDSDFWRI